jgi:hypothetical protein
MLKIPTDLDLAHQRLCLVSSTFSWDCPFKVKNLRNQYLPLLSNVESELEGNLNTVIPQPGDFSQRCTSTQLSKYR